MCLIENSTQRRHRVIKMHSKAKELCSKDWATTRPKNIIQDATASADDYQLNNAIYLYNNWHEEDYLHTDTLSVSMHHLHSRSVVTMRQKILPAEIPLT